MTTLPMPSLTSIDNAANALRRTATVKQARLINKAQAQLHHGAVITVCTDGALLIPSGTTAGVMYHLDSLGHCDCRATTPTCRHFWLRAIIELAHAMPREIKRTRFEDFDHMRIVRRVRELRGETMPNLMHRSRVDYQKALAEMNECF